MPEAQQIDDDGWQPTPNECRLRARLLDGTIVEYQALRRGDVFQAITPYGSVIDPFTWGWDENVFAKCLDDSRMDDEGWKVHIELFSRSELKTVLS